VLKQFPFIHYFFQILSWYLVYQSWSYNEGIVNLSGLCVGKATRQHFRTWRVCKIDSKTYKNTWFSSPVTWRC